MKREKNEEGKKHRGRDRESKQMRRKKLRNMQRGERRVMKDAGRKKVYGKEEINMETNK